jgi:AraC-like DNA-binding protein
MMPGRQRPGIDAEPFEQVDANLFLPRINGMALESRDELDVQALADLAGLGRAHFSRVFKTCEGVPLAEFVLAERMRARGERARQRRVQRQDGGVRLRLRRPELFRQGFPLQVRRQSDRVSHHGHVFQSARRDWKVDDAHESARTRRREQIVLVRSEWRREAGGAPIYVRGI